MTAAHHDTDDRVLERVRKLLSRAEHPATPPAEAEACSAKAAELMARHLIDRAMLDAAAPARDAPVVRRIVVDPPYTVAKVVLLDEVARAFAVRMAVGGSGEASSRLCTLVGFAGEVAMVELLFTSLLLQAATAMRLASEGHPRVKAFRRSFLFGYAAAIGARLHAVQEDVARDATEASPGASLVLADRRTRVDAAFAAEFPRLGTFRASAGHGGGFVAGHDAGAVADLSAGRRGLGRQRGELSA